MVKIEVRVAKLEDGIKSQNVKPISGIWLVGISPDGSSDMGGFLPIGRTQEERTKNRVAAYKYAGLDLSQFAE